MPSSARRREERNLDRIEFAKVNISFFIRLIPKFEFVTESEIATQGNW